MKLSVMSQIHSFSKKHNDFFEPLFFQGYFHEIFEQKKINIWNYMQVTYQSITY